MVDPGENVSVTVRREFMEEAMDSTTASEEERRSMEDLVSAFFKRGKEIYKGIWYIDAYLELEIPSESFFAAS